MSRFACPNVAMPRSRRSRATIHPARSVATLRGKNDLRLFLAPRFRFGLRATERGSSGGSSTGSSTLPLRDSTRFRFERGKTASAPDAAEATSPYRQQHFCLCLPDFHFSLGDLQPRLRHQWRHNSLLDSHRDIQSSHRDLQSSHRDLQSSHRIFNPATGIFNPPQELPCDDDPEAVHIRRDARQSNMR